MDGIAFAADPESGTTRAQFDRDFQVGVFKQNEMAYDVPTNSNVLIVQVGVNAGRISQLCSSSNGFCVSWERS
jgi:hypothetical protein